MLERKKTKQELAFWLLLLLAAVYCLPMICSTGYTVYWADDFTHYNSMMSMPGETLLLKSLAYTKHIYLTWQGTYFAIFLQSILSPLHRGGLPLLRGVSIANILLFLGSVYYFFYKLLKGNKTLALVCFHMVLLPLLFYGQYNEIYYWLSGQCSYSFPLSLALLSLGGILGLDASRHKKVRFSVSAALVVLAVGGSLEVSGTVCFAIVILATAEFFQKGKLSKAAIGYFALAFAGSLINAAAPGNFVRHAVIDENRISLIKCTVRAVLCCVRELRQYLLGTDTAFIAFVMLAFAVGLVGGLRIETKKCVAFVVEFLLLPVVTVFPVAMGYSTTDVSGVPRVKFVFDFVFLAAALAVAFLAGNWFKRREFGVSGQTVATVLVCLAVFAVLERSAALGAFQPIAVTKCLIKGTLAQAASEVEAAYAQIENAEEENVVVVFPNVPDWYNVSPLSSDPSDWKNVSVAQYYGKESVSFVKPE